MAGLRVLNLADPLGTHAGKLLADLGADVLRVEPPTADPMRRWGPFLGNRPGSERSLCFWSGHSGQRSLALDPAQALDAERLRGLAAGVVQTMDEVAADPHPAARGFCRTGERPALGDEAVEAGVPWRVADPHPPAPSPQGEGESEAQAGSCHPEWAKGPSPRPGGYGCFAGSAWQRAVMTGGRPLNSAD